MHIALIYYYTWPDAKIWGGTIEIPIAEVQTILAHKFKLSKLPQFGPVFKNLVRHMDSVFRHGFITVGSLLENQENCIYFRDSFKLLEHRVSELPTGIKSAVKDWALAEVLLEKDGHKV